MTAATRLRAFNPTPEPLEPLNPVGAFRRLGLPEDPTELVQAVEAGLPVAIIERLAMALNLHQHALLKLARIAPATLTRRRRDPAGVLARDESDRIYRIAAAYRGAVQLFEGDAQAAQTWLQEPARALGGATPLGHLATEAGAAEVRDLIGRLEYGVY
jgi:putative toxin-antitoxin system antitoxin component (TIGR02293 family)